MQNTILIFCFLLCNLFMPGCDNQDAELIITQEPEKKKKQAVQKKKTVEAEKKPLIPITPEDTIKILVREDGAPGMYLGDDGKVYGFYVDLEKIIMEEMGQAYKFQAYSDVGQAALKLKSGVYHIALAAPDLPEYRSFLNLSIPYEVLHYVTFVQKGNNEIGGSSTEEILKSLHGKKVGVQTRGHIFQVLRDIREINLIEYPTTTKALAALNKGLLDAVPDVKRIGIYYSNLNSWDIVPVGEPIISYKVTTAFSKAHEKSLINRYNKALKKLQDNGRVEALYKLYFGPMGDDAKP